VLIVGASATGAQLADELNEAGRQVTLAVGTHVRLPRRYRGRDILSWMVEMGAFRAAADPAEERLSPPPQLVGGPDNRDLDLGNLQRAGVRLTGRATAAQSDRMFFADDLEDTLEKADSGLTQLLGKIDGYIEANVSGPVPKAEPIPPVRCPEPVSEIDFDDAGISCIIWATGYERKFPWLKLPILNQQGDIRHERGITPEPGVAVRATASAPMPRSWRITLLRVVTLARRRNSRPGVAQRPAPVSASRISSRSAARS
jgi:putative flavoprotein involved in K+ transport